MTAWEEEWRAFTTASGQRMTFAPGQVWIVLAYR
jgi:hypothetical protein